MSDRVARIEARLREAFNPTELQVHDDSHRHIGHAGARDGAGHYRVEIRADALAGLPALEAHRRIYAALGDMMGSEIHALSISARGV